MAEAYRFMFLSAEVSFVQRLSGRLYLAPLKGIVAEALNLAVPEREGGPLAVEGSNHPNRQIHLSVRSSRTSNGRPHRLRGMNWLRHELITS